mgnify:CR=1 FL=1
MSKASATCRLNKLTNCEMDAIRKSRRSASSDSLGSDGGSGIGKGSDEAGLTARRRGISCVGWEREQQARRRGGMFTRKGSRAQGSRARAASLSGSFPRATTHYRTSLR